MKAAECDLISEIPKDSPIWLSSGTTPNGTMMVLYVPADYEECAECGFDHYYRAASSKMWHYENWPSHVWLRDNTKYRIADWRMIGVGLRDSKLVHAPMPELEYQRLVSDVLRIQRERKNQAKAQAAANAEADRLIRRESALRSILGDRS